MFLLSFITLRSAKATRRAMTDIQLFFNVNDLVRSKTAMKYIPVELTFVQTYQTVCSTSTNISETQAKLALALSEFYDEYNFKIVQYQNAF